jgi:hypothetical protein
MSDADIQQTDHRGHSILMAAAEVGHTQAVELLIERCEDLDFEVGGQTAASLAFSNGHHGLVLSLIKANAKYPNNYNHENASDDLKTFVNLSQGMHEKVRDVDEEDEESLETTRTLITDNSQRFPTMRHFFDTRNSSLLKTAIINKMFEIYKLLLTLNIFLADHEDVEGIMDELTRRQKKRLENINEELSTNIFTEPMMILMRNCKLGPGIPKADHGKYIEFIRKGFDFLFQIEPVSWILKVAAARRNFKIIFDFKRDSVQFLVPSEPYANGLCYPAGKIYIAAKDMLDPDTAANVYAVIAHELCHFAVFLIYGNNAKPYREKEILIESDFERITEECEEVSERNEIVNSVFEDYPDEMFHAELIVRPPQMMVTYFHDQNFLREMRQTFFRLFDFFEVNVVSEMERELPNLEKKYARNKETEKLKRWIYFFIAFVAFLIPFGIGAFFYFKEPIYSWSGLDNQQRETLTNAKVKVYGANVRFKDLFANDSEVYNLLSSEHIKYALKENSAELSNAISSIYKHKIYLTYSNMTENLRESFVNQKVNFQGEKVKINQILSNFDVLYNLTTSEVHDTLKGRPINISSKFMVKTKFFIERYFIDEKIKINRKSHYLGSEINTNHPEVKNFSRILMEVENLKVFVLSDVAGEGKSTTFGSFTEKLKQKFPENWIQFVDLKKHFKAYKKGLEFNFTIPEELSNFLTSNLLDLNEIEREVFNELYSESRTIFLWDGIDEIAPLYKDFMLNLTSTIKLSSECIQFISTRPQFASDFRERFNIKSHKLMPIGEGEKFEFVTKTIAIEKFALNPENVWKNLKNFNNNKLKKFKINEISKNNPAFYNENKKLFKNLEKGQKVIESIERSEDLITNPLLLVMISEILVDDDFDVNTILSLYSIYDFFIEKKLEIVQSKEGSIRNVVAKVLKSSSVNVMQIHQSYALQLIFRKKEKKLQSEEDNDDESFALDLQIMESIEKLSELQISRFGILNVNLGYFSFAHRTFAEFLVARYLIDNFENFSLIKPEEDSDLKIYMLNLVLFSGNFEFVKKMIFSYAKIENETTMFFEFLREYRGYSSIDVYENDYEFLSIVIQTIERFSTFNNFQTFFNLQKSKENVNVLKSFHYLKNEFDERFQRRFDLKELLGTIFRASYGDRWTLLHEAVRENRKFSFVEKLLQMYRENLNKNEITKLIFTRTIYDYHHKSSLMFAGRECTAYELKLFWDFIDEMLNEEEKKKLLLMESKTYKGHTQFQNYSGTALKFSTWNKEPSTFLFMTKIYEKYFTRDEIQEILMKYFKSVHIDQLPFLFHVISDASLETALEVSKYLTNLYEEDKLELRKLLLQLYWNEGESIFYKYKNDLVNKDKLEIFVKLLRTTFDDEIEFMDNFKISQLKLNIFKELADDFSVESLEYLAKEDKPRRWSQSDLMFLYFSYDKIKSTFGEENLKKILQSKDYDGATILHALNLNEETNLLTENLISKIELNLNPKEISSLIFTQTGHEKNIPIMLAAKNNNLHKIEVFWDLINKILNEDDKRKLLLLTDDNLKTSLQFSTFNKDPNSFLFMKKIYEKIFNKEKIQEILLKFDEENFSFLKYMYELASPDTTLEVSKYLKTLFENEKLELRKFLSHRDERTRSVYSWLKKDKDDDGKAIFENFEDKLKHQEKLKNFKELWRQTFQENQERESEESLKISLLNLEALSGLLDHGNGTQNLDNLRDSNWSSDDFEFFILKFDEIKQNYGDEKLTTLLLSENDKHWTLLHEIILNKGHESFIESFFKKMLTILNATEVLNLITQKDDNEETLLMLTSAKRSLNESKFLWNFIAENFNEDEKRNILLLEQKRFETALQFSTFNQDPNSFLFMKEIYEKLFTEEKIREIFLKLHEDHISFIFHLINDASHETAREVSKYLKNLFENEKLELRKILSHRDKNGDSIFSYFKEKKIFVEILKIFIELFAKTFDESDEIDESVSLELLSYHLKAFKALSLNFTEESLNIFENQDELEWTSDDVKFFVSNFDKINHVLGYKNIEKILTSKTNKDQSFFHIMLDDKLVDFDEIIQSILDNFDWDENHQSKSTFFLQEIEHGETSLMYAIKRRTLEDLKAFWHLIDKILNENEKRKLLLIESYHRTALQHSAENKDPNSFLFTKEIYEKFFTQEELQVMLIIKDQNSFSFILHVIELASPETALEVSKFLENLFKDQKLELRKILSHRNLDDNGNGQSIFSEFKSQNLFKENLDFFIKLLRETFDDEAEFTKSVRVLESYLRVFRKLSNNFSAESLKVFENNFDSWGWSFGDFEFFNYYFEKIKKKFGDESVTKIISKKNFKHQTVFHMILKTDGREHVLELFLKNIENLPNIAELVLNFLFMKNDSWHETPLMIAAKEANSKELKLLWNFLDENLNETVKREVLLYEEAKFKIALHFSAENQDLNSFLFMKEIYEKFFTEEEIRKFLKSPFIDHIFGENTFIFWVIYEASHETALEVSKYLDILFKYQKFELRELLSYRDIEGDSIFSTTILDYEESKKDKLNIFIDLLRKTYEDQKEKFRENLKILQNKFSLFRILSEHFHEFSNSSDFKWSTQSLNFFNVTLENFNRDFGHENLRKSYFIILRVLAKESKYKQQIEPFLKILSDFLSKNEIANLFFRQENHHLETLLMWAAKGNNLKPFWNFINENLNEVEKGKILLLEQDRFKTALQYSAENQDSNSFLFMKEIYEKFFTKEKIRAILMKIRKNYNSFIYSIIDDEGSSETALEVSKYLGNLFENKKIELIEILTHRGEEGETIFSELKTDTYYSDKFSKFNELYKRICDENQEEKCQLGNE